MPGPGKGGRYHHGDLRAALVDTAIEIIGERGVRGFSLAARGHVMLLLDEGPAREQRPSSSPPNEPPGRPSP